MISATSRWDGYAVFAIAVASIASCSVSTLAEKTSADASSGLDGATGDDSPRDATDAMAGQGNDNGGPTAGGPADAARAEADSACFEMDAATAPRLPGGKLQASFDARGLAHLSYNGVVLVDLDSSVGDAFGVDGYWLGGTSQSGPTGHMASWDAPSQTLTWSYGWGSVSCAFAIPVGVDNLEISLTVHNTSSQRLDSIAIAPLGITFPSLPAGWGAANDPQFHNSIHARADGLSLNVASGRRRRPRTSGDDQDGASASRNRSTSATVSGGISCTG